MTGVLIGSSLLIVIVAALRTLLRGRVSARLIYALWGVVLLRLLVPFSLELDLPSAEGAARTVYGRTELSEAMLPYDSVSAPYAAGYSRSVLPEDDPIQPYLDAGEAAPEYRVELRGEGTPEAETRFVFLRPWAEVLSGYLRPVWLLGTFAALALLAYTNLSFWAKLRRTRRPIGVSDCGLTAYETDAIASPCLFGLFRPAIYVRAEDAGRLRHVLAHEDCHFRHLDHIWALLRAACLAVYWWDPLVWLAAALSRTDCELACDEAALSRLGEAERIPYGETLITMAAKPRPGELLRASSPIGSGKRELRARILAIARRGKRLVVPAVLAVCLCLFCAACAFTGAENTAAGEDAPAVSDGIGDVSTLPAEAGGDAPASLNENKYTFLLAGLDDKGYNVDLVMLGSFDTAAHKIDIVTIPRPTVVDMTPEGDWPFTLSTVYPKAEISEKGSGIERLMDTATDLLGFRPDIYAFIELEAFEELIDAMGGVDFEVTEDMHYSDPQQGLYISLEEGMQHLDGAQALGLVRFRMGGMVLNWDVTGTQQAFLKAVTEQLLASGELPELSLITEIFSEHINTSLTASNIAYFARQLMNCDAADIKFHTIPSYGVRTDQYYCEYIDVDGWLEMVNEYLNPYSQPVSEENVNIQIMADGKLSSTAEKAGA